MKNKPYLQNFTKNANLNVNPIACVTARGVFFKFLKVIQDFDFMV